MRVQIGVLFKTGFAEEGLEQSREHVEGGHACGDEADEPEELAYGIGRDEGTEEDFVFGEEAGERGIPAMAKTPIVMVQKVTGMRLRRSPMLRISCSPERAWMTEPAARKSRALKKAWVRRWKIPAVLGTNSQARNIYPNWETVE